METFYVTKVSIFLFLLLFANARIRIGEKRWDRALFPLTLFIIHSYRIRIFTH